MNTRRLRAVDSALRSFEGRRAREKALIVLGGDGDVEAYGLETLDVHIATRPYLPTPRGEILGDRFLDQTLPLSHRELFFPGKLRARGVVEKHTVEVLERFEANVAILDALSQLQVAIQSRADSQELLIL